MEDRTDLVPYDSLPDTVNHIGLVQAELGVVIQDLIQRALRHDQSKKEEPEKSAIDRVRPRLKELEYGTLEYKELKHEFSQYHYAANDHHLEHFANGIEGMNLLQIVEMFCDWCAAVKTHRPEDNIFKSIDIICAEHGINDQVKQIFINTAEYLGYSRGLMESDELEAEFAIAAWENEGNFYFDVGKPPFLEDSEE